MSYTRAWGGSLAGRTSLAATLLALTLMLGGCQNRNDAQAEAAPQPVLIGPENIAVAERQELVTGPLVSGSLEPERDAQVRAEIGGSVVEARAEQGEAVKRGAVLARIDAMALADELLSAHAAARSAEGNLQVVTRNAERSAALAKAGAIAERDLEQARWSVTNAEAARADAQARLVSVQERLSKATIRAPFTGIVSDRQVSAGDVVQAGALLYTIVDPSSMRLEASVPAEQLGALKIGTPVEFTVSGYAGRTFTGRIERISPAVDPATRQVKIYVTLPNAKGSLVAGLFAEGRVSTERHAGTVVPRAAVDTRGLRPVVMRLADGRVERVEVALGLQDRASERVEVTSGVAPGDTLLLGASQGIAPGTVVRLRQDGPAAGAR